MPTERAGKLAQPLFMASSIALNFERFVPIRRESNKIEDAFGELFNPPTVIGLSDEVNPVAPRLLLTSKHGHSQLVISQMNMVLNTTTYTSDFQQSVEARVSYSQTRLARMVSALDALEIVPLFTGASSQAQLVYEGTDDEEFVRRSFTKVIGADAPACAYDATLKVSTEVDRAYYCIVTRDIARTWSVDPNTALSQRMPRSTAEKRSINVTVDFNDRLSFHNDAAYRSDLSKSSKVLSTGFERALGECEAIAKAFNEH